MNTIWLKGIAGLALTWAWLASSPAAYAHKHSLPDHREDASSVSILRTLDQKASDPSPSKELPSQTTVFCLGLLAMLGARVPSAQTKETAKTNG